jgi:hypothetical protein
LQGDPDQLRNQRQLLLERLGQTLHGQAVLHGPVEIALLSVPGGAALQNKDEPASLLDFIRIRPGLILRPRQIEAAVRHVGELARLVQNSRNFAHGFVKGFVILR